MRNISSQEDRLIANLEQFIQTAGLVSMQIAVRRGELGVATGIFFTVMSVGGAIGVAIAGM